MSALVVFNVPSNIKTGMLTKRIKIISVETDFLFIYPLLLLKNEKNHLKDVFKLVAVKNLEAGDSYGRYLGFD